MSRPPSTNQRRSDRPQSAKQRPTAHEAAKVDATTTAKGSSGAATPDSSTERSTESGAVATARPAPSGPTAVSISQLAKRYGDTEALAPLDLRIVPGERVTIIGHNGSGKTTLLRMLAGMLEPSDGKGVIANHPIGSLEARAAVSYLSDQPVFYDDLSVWEHLEFIARLHNTENWEQQAVDVVDMVGLGARVDDLPITFSRGLKQKAAIAMAFVRPYDVMLVDEPFVGLDRVGREALLELFRLAHDDGATLLVATHELSTVRTSTRLLALSGGELTYDGLPDQADVVMLTEGVPIGDD